MLASIVVQFFIVLTCQRFDGGGGGPQNNVYCAAEKTKIPETLTVEQCTLFGLVTQEENNGADPNDVHAHDSNRGIEKGLKVFCYLCESQPSILTCPDCNSATYCSVLS